jgi:hypothetical protein
MKTERDLMQYVEQECDMAKKIAQQQHGIDLILAEDHIGKVENILSEINEFYQQSVDKGKPFSEDLLSRLSFTFGCFIGEVLRQEVDGAWTTEPEDSKETLLLVCDLKNGRFESRPQNRVYKRITTDVSENVAYWYQVMKQEIQKNR